MKVLIAEKPSVAKEYIKLLELEEKEKFKQENGCFVGKNWIITWCYGHLVQLANPEHYGWSEWSLDNLPMIPNKWELLPIEDAKTQFNIVKKILHSAELIVNGTDAGREGELIFRLTVLLAGAQNKPQKRLWLSSFVMKDMQIAWRNLLDAKEKESLFQAAYLRAKGDWLIGMNASRGYVIKTGIKNLSVGRVQTPTLNLIVKRDFEVENFKEKTWNVLYANWKGIKFTYQDKEGEKKFDNADKLKEIKNILEGKDAVCSDLIKEIKNENPPKPFTLSDLQIAANNRYGYKAKQTLDFTQSLYEKKLVTYPRTDSNYLPENMLEDAYKILSEFKTKEQEQFLVPSGTKTPVFNDEKVTDHFAIIPTGNKNGINELSNSEKNIYNLIVERFILSFGLQYTFEQYSIKISSFEHDFTATVKKDLKLGFKGLIFNQNNEDEEKEEEIKVSDNFQISTGDKDVLKNLEIGFVKKSRPKYFTDATLLTAMINAGKEVEEKEYKNLMKGKGLGTQSTRAGIIETLKKREYIYEKGKQIISTEKGRQLISLVDEKLKSAELTGEWEYKLLQVEQGKIKEADFYSELLMYVNDICSLFKNADDSFAEKMKIAVSADQYPCPVCKQGKILINKGGAFCSDQTNCGFKAWRIVAKKSLNDNSLETLIKKGKTGVIKGFEGKNGKFDAALKIEGNKVVFEFPKK
jgi:DNA topoisomerase-3